jgi:hypothetical protein
MTLVSEASDAELAKLLAKQEIDSCNSRASGNLMRMTRGDGKPLECSEQADRLVKACRPAGAVSVNGPASASPFQKQECLRCRLLRLLLRRVVDRALVRLGRLARGVMSGLLHRLRRGGGRGGRQSRARLKRRRGESERGDQAEGCNQGFLHLSSFPVIEDRVLHRASPFWVNRLDTQELERFCIGPETLCLLAIGTKLLGLRS